MNVEQAKERFRGPVVSVATPFTSDFQLDLTSLRNNIRFMIDQGIRSGQGVLLVAAAGDDLQQLLEQR